MNNQILEAVSTAFFCWFFNFAIDHTPFLKWYRTILTKFPYNLSQVLGLCPFCMAPWLFLFFAYAPIPQIIPQIAYAFGWAYAANCFVNKYLD